MREKLRGVLQWIGTSVLLIAASAFVGTVLLILAAMIPETAMEDHALESAWQIIQEGSYRYAFDEVKGSRLDNFTDGLMLNTAYYHVDDLSEDAMEGTMVIYDDHDAWDSLYYWFSQELDAEAEVVTYPRYWLGMQIIISPLLMVMNYAQIRSLNMIVQLLMVFVMSGLLLQRGGWSA